MIGRAQGPPVSITGLGCHVPERVVTNEELATLVETSDEWIVERTGIRERRFAGPGESTASRNVVQVSTVLRDFRLIDQPLPVCDEQVVHLVLWRSGQVVAEGKHPVLSAEHARHALEIMLKAIESARTGRALDLETTF